MRKAILNENYLGFDFVDDLVYALLDHSLQGTVVLKRNPPRIHYANPLACRILGLQAENGKEIPDRPFLKFIHVQDRDEFLDTLSVCLEGNTASPLKELRLKGRDQRLIWVVYTGTPISHKGRPAALIHFQEITENKKIREDLKQIEQNLERQGSTYQAVCSAHREEMKQKEEELLKKQQELAEINSNLMETNRAIATLARNMEMGRLEMEREVAHKVKTKILPIMAGIKNAKIPETVLTEMDILEAHLKTLIARDLPGFDDSMLLTGTELRIASMIKNGLNSSQIAMQLSVSQDTIKTHRRNIRRKFRLQNQRLNLPTFLREKMEGSVNERIRNYGG